MVKYFIIIDDEQIVSRGCGAIVPDDSTEVTEELYEQLVRLPATFEVDEDGNMTVTPTPEPEQTPQPAPEPSIAELRDQQIAQAEAIAAIFERLEGGV